MQLAILMAVLSNAEPAAEVQDQASPCADYERPIAIETNVLWPLVPGGIAELRVMFPLLRSDKRDFRGELVAGTYADFANRIVRDETWGKVATLDAKLGWRQFLVQGFHLELDVNFGWRHEGPRPDGREAVDGFAARAWVMAGWQWEITRRLYVNARGGPGIHLFRTDAYGSTERVLTGGVDLNLGVRL